VTDLVHFKWLTGEKSVDWEAVERETVIVIVPPPPRKNPVITRLFRWLCR